MIPVKFTMDKGTDFEQYLLEASEHMPWLDYLVKNRTDLEIKSTFDTPRFQYIITYCFTLPEQKETFYRLKYGDGT